MYLLISNSCVFHPLIGSIPFEPKNSSYRHYLEWLALGNTPIPENTANGIVYAAKDLISHINSGNALTPDMKQNLPNLPKYLASIGVTDIIKVPLTHDAIPSTNPPQLMTPKPIHTMIVSSAISAPITAPAII